MLIHHVNILGLAIVHWNSASLSIFCLDLNRYCLVQIHALPKNYFIPLNSVQQAVGTQCLQVTTIWAFITMDSSLYVIILQMTIQAYLAMAGLLSQVAYQAQWAIASLLNAMIVQALVAMRCLKRCSVNHQLVLSL